MTKQEAKEIIDSSDYFWLRPTEEEYEALNMASDHLAENDEMIIERDVLDKIRAEISANSIYVMPQYGRTIREADVLRIIDKYTAESKV